MILAGGVSPDPDPVAAAQVPQTGESVAWYQALSPHLFADAGAESRKTDESVKNATQYVPGSSVAVAASENRLKPVTLMSGLPPDVATVDVATTALHAPLAPVVS